jgi:hypothetical protein
MSFNPKREGCRVRFYGAEPGTCEEMEVDDAEQMVIEANAKLVKNDDSEVVCQEHNVAKRWGDLSPIVQLAILAGLDVRGDRCIMDEC